MFEWFKTLPKKHFLCFVSKDFASCKKACNIYTRMLEFTFPRKMRWGRGWIYLDTFIYKRII